MATYIKRALALDVINHANDCDCFKNYDGYSMTFDMIDEMPSADVEKVRHGMWQYGGDGFIRCSSCRERGFSGIEFPYCPYCGAKMDKE